MQLKIQLAVSYFVYKTQGVLYSHAKNLIMIILSPISLQTHFLLLGILQDVMNKVRSDTILDMNLEKSRVKELVSMRWI